MPRITARFAVARRATARTGLALVAVAMAAVTMFGAAIANAGITLEIGDIESPSFSAKSVRAELRENDLSVKIASLRLEQVEYQKVALSCPGFQLEGSTIRCETGVLEAGGKWPIGFEYQIADRKLNLVVRPERAESWTLQGDFARQPATVEIEITQGKLQRLAGLAPNAAPKISAGVVDGKVAFGSFAKNNAHNARIRADLRVKGAAFSDAAGLHAGDKLDMNLHLAAESRVTGWQWNVDLDWQGGEVFWQPLYLVAGHQLSAAGNISDDAIKVERGKLRLARIGGAEFSAVWNRKNRELTAAELRTGDLDLPDLYATMLRPLLEQTALAELAVAGKVRVDWRAVDGATEALTLDLKGAALDDKQARFAMKGIEAYIPWQRAASTKGKVSIASGQIFQIPLGAASIPLDMDGLRVAIPHADIPILDGRISLDEFRAESVDGAWRWQFAAGLTPISMQVLTQQLGMQQMHGSLSAVIPRVRFQASTLNVDGALLFKVFDGTIVAKNLRLLDPLGRTPRLSADLDMRNLDLDLLTRTFSFGSISGRIDAEISGLELADWRPVQFDAALRSSPGDYRKRISQTAVQNISALGGAGAVAALQRSFLRFFEQFGYSSIGFSCKLANGVCEMGGIKPVEQGYVIVEGGGIPAITVMGYNRRVDWQELLGRLQRITQDNVKAIVR